MESKAEDVTNRTDDDLRQDGWVCGCVKRDRSTGRMTHIKINARSVAKCRRCGATRDESDAMAAKPLPPPPEPQP